MTTADAAGLGVVGALLEQTPDFAVIVTTPDGTITGWHGASERLLGHGAAEAIGQPLSIVFTPQDRAMGLDRHEISVACRLGRSEDDRWHTRRDGSLFWASGVLTAVREADGAVVALCKILRDKTDTVAQIQRLQNQLVARDGELAAEDRFLRSTAHELRNPLMPIASALTLLQRSDADHLRPQALKILESQLAVLARLVDDMNAPRRTEDEITLARVPLSLNLALQTVVDGLAPTAAQRNQQLTLVVPPADIRVFADPARLQQMLLNLLNNAVKYTPAGGEIWVSASVELGMAVVRVEDTGIGIAAEMLPKIFELFTREDRTSPIAGDGVGLAIVERLASLHGGGVEVRSPGRDKGSAFGLRLPVVAEETPSADVGAAGPGGGDHPA